MKDCIVVGASDGALDMKEAFAARGCQFGDAYRILRVRKDSYIEECQLTGPTNISDWGYIWFPDPTVRLFVLNCTFDGQPTIPADRIHMEEGVFDPSQIVYLTEPQGLLLDDFIHTSNGLLGDLDGDGDVDLADYHQLAECLAGPDVAHEASCTCADIDNDSDVDLADFSAFAVGFAG